MSLISAVGKTTEKFNTSPKAVTTKNRQIFSKFFQRRLISDLTKNLENKTIKLDVEIQYPIVDKENISKSFKNLPSQEEINILFLQELLQDFEKVLTITEDFKGFDKYATDWMKNYIEENMKKTKLEYIFEVLLKFYSDKHLEYFSSLLGFFYQYGIGNKVNKRKALDMYKLSTMQ